MQIRTQRHTRSGRPRLAVVLVTSVGVAACASPSWDRAWPEARPLGRGLESVRAPTSPEAVVRHHSTPANPQGELRLRDALAMALERNPDLEAFSWAVRAREARTLQAGLRPNPEVSLEVENFAGSGPTRSFDASETTLALAQLIETAGKRRARQRIAESEQRLAGWDYEAARVDVFSRVTRAFVAVLATQEQLDLAGELLDVAREALRTVETRLREGAASPVERARAAVALSAARVEREQRQADLDKARTELASFWGGPKPVFEAVAGDLFDAPTPPPLSSLARSLERSPALARWREELAQRESLITLADAERIPDVTLGAGIRHLAQGSDDALIAVLRIPIPVFDQNQGERLATRFDLSRARSLERSARTRLRTALDTAHRELLAAHARVEALRDETLPAAEHAYQQTLRAYRRGLFRYLDVLDAQRTLFDIRANFITALQAYHTAVAAIEGLTGEPVQPTGDPVSSRS